LKTKQRDPRQLYLPIENWTPDELQARKQDEQAKLAAYLRRKPMHQARLAAIESSRRERSSG